MTCFSLNEVNHALHFIRKWRHTRGYGVHSPLAFRIVKECIRPDRRYGFYCDSYLDFEYHEDRRELQRARLIIRLLHLLRPAHAWIPNADKRLLTAIKMVMPRMRVATQSVCPKDTDFIISFDRHDSVECWRRMAGQEQCGMLFFGRNEEITEGVTLEIESKDFRILLRRPGMAKVKYDV